jgi:hypothetical protein
MPSKSCLSCTLLFQVGYNFVRHAINNEPHKNFRNNYRIFINNANEWNHNNHTMMTYYLMKWRKVKPCCWIVTLLEKDFQYHGHRDLHISYGDRAAYCFFRRGILTNVHRVALYRCVWYVSNVSIIFYAPCLFIHYLLCVLLHFVAFLCIFWN